MLRHVSWATGEPVRLLAGEVTARGNASPQVRDSQQAAAIGDAAALAAHLQAAITQSLAEVLQGMEPSPDQLAGLRDDIASAALVASNMELRGIGVILLDLSITAMEFADL
jgi:hypothetical protein